MDAPPLTGQDAVAALSHPDLVPPPRPAQFTAGATADLRDSMARFSNHADHPARRQALETTLAAIDPNVVERTARETTIELLGEPVVDIMALGLVVPSYTLASIFGFAGKRDQIRDDAEWLARVIGRNEPSTAESDAAAARLLDTFADHPEPVAAVSVLYQNFDASAGLIATAVLAAYTTAPHPNEGQTVRVAESATTVGTRRLAEGDAIAISLEDMRFGAGPHRCPGEDVALAIARGTVHALVQQKYRFRSSLVQVAESGFPVKFSMEGQP